MAGAPPLRGRRARQLALTRQASGRRPAASAFRRRRQLNSILGVLANAVFYFYFYSAARV